MRILGWMSSAKPTKATHWTARYRDTDRVKKGQGAPLLRTRGAAGHSRTEAGPSTGSSAGWFPAASVPSCCNSASVTSRNSCSVTETHAREANHLWERSSTKRSALSFCRVSGGGRARHCQTGALLLGVPSRASTFVPRLQKSHRVRRLLLRCLCV